MTRTALIPSFLLLAATLATSTSADAAPIWMDGPLKSGQFSCPVTGNAAYIVQTQVGYHTDTNVPLKTGDVEYIHAISTNTSGCIADAVGFEFILPPGASFAVSTSNPVYCFRTEPGKAPYALPYVPGSSECLQTPTAGGATTNGKWFGGSQLASGWSLEIQVPVVYNAALVGAANSTHIVKAATISQYGGTLLPTVPITVGYRAQFQSLTNLAVTANTAKVGLDLRSYFESGTFYVDYGTTTAVATSTVGGFVPAGSVNFPNVTADLPGLAPGTTYYWRARFVTTSHGTFTSTTQSFTTPVAPTFALSVVSTGRGLGKVISSPAGIDCGYASANACSTSVAQGTVVSLYAMPSTPAYMFTGWTGACSGTGACNVTMDAAKSVTATFAFFDFGTPLPDPYPRRR